MAQRAPNPDAFAGSDVGGFEHAIRDLGLACQKDGSKVAQLVLGAISAIDKAIALTERERGRRIETLLRSVPLSRADCETVAARLVNFRPASKNAVMSVMPPDLRPTIYRAKAADAPPPAPASGISPLASEPSLATPTRETPPIRNSPYRAVLLLGSEEEHAPNTSLLKQHGIIVLRQERLDGLEEIVQSDLAGVVVAGSVLRTLEAPDQEKSLVRLFRLSSLLFLRIDAEVLDVTVSRRLHDLRRDACCGDSDASDFCQGSGCRLSQADIAAIERVANLLEVAASTRFHPRQIGSTESFLVRVAATKHVRGHRLDHGIKLDQIQTSFFAQGRSRAKVVMVRPDDGGAGFVMKVDEAEQLRREMQHYYKYISWWDGGASPELYFHGSAAAIIFSLVDSPDVPGSPAPTLDEQIEKAMNGELGNWGKTVPREEDLAVAIERSIVKLASLNQRQCTDEGHGYKWIADTIEQLENKGITWRIHDLQGNPLDLPSLASRAAAIVEQLQSAALAHGDVHLKNILLRDNREPFLIDYEYSGPGHPCFDLVRLDAAVMFRCFRAVAPEPRVAALVAAMSTTDASYAKLEREYRDLLTSVGNRLAAKTSILVRQQCLDLLTKRGAGADAYYAMKVLITVSALTLLDQQSATCRATLSALAPMLLS